LSTNAVFTNIVGTGVTTNGPAILQSATNYAAGTANNVIDVSLPFTAVANSNVVGSFYVYDVTGGVNRTCIAGLNSTTTVSGVIDGANNYIGASGFTGALASGSAVLGKVIYEATT
jgi:hypothetical protein